MKSLIRFRRCANESVVTAEDHVVSRVEQDVSKSRWLCGALTLLSAVALFVASPGSAEPTDDQQLFVSGTDGTTNVMFNIDTSGSMAEILWHPDYTYGDGETSSCRPYDPDSSSYHQCASGCSYFKEIDPDEDGNDFTFTCENMSGDPQKTIKLYSDQALNTSTQTLKSTWYSKDYINWLLDDATIAKTSIQTDRAAENDMEYKCLPSGSGGETYNSLRRSRWTAARKAIEEVMCLINQDGGGDGVRFGVSRFRDDNSGKTGGFVIVPNHEYTDSYVLAYASSSTQTTQTHPEWISQRLDEVNLAYNKTPLQESLFQLYTYFLSRDSAKCPTVSMDATVTIQVPCVVEECEHRTPDYGAGEESCRYYYGWRRRTGTKTYSNGTCDETTTGLQDVAFPTYTFQTNEMGELNTDLTDWRVPESPVTSSCMNNYVIVISDGDPTYDDFSDSNSEAKGFDLVEEYIGGKTLDDIAEVMYEQDMYPDATNGGTMDGKQNVKVYTVGYNAPLTAQALLAAAATRGGGANFNTGDTEVLTQNLTAVVAELIKGAQSFAASAVPASRQTLGSYFYTSFFKHSGGDPLWEGHLMALNMSLGGGIFDKKWQCALEDADPDVCRDGTLMLDELLDSADGDDFPRYPLFDVADEIPAPADRSLYFGEPMAFGTLAPSVPPFTADEVSASDLGIAGAEPGAAHDTALVRELGWDETTAETKAKALTGEELADIIVNYVRGCSFGSDHFSSCDTRKDADGNLRQLGDIFHSNPLLVGPPDAYGLGEGYLTFKNTYKWRPMMIYAGANDGLFHAFKAGDWVCSDDVCEEGERPESYSASGVELFGFMPYSARERIQYLPIDDPVERKYYFVDGSPVAADVWIRRVVKSSGGEQLPVGNLITKKVAKDDKEPEQWRTVVVGGMRQGGSSYFALDVTNPESANFPGYLWEFPCEHQSVAGGCSNADTAVYEKDEVTKLANPTGSAYAIDDYVGETWSEPVIYRVKVLNSDGEEADRWVALFGGGYHTEGDPRSTGYDGSDLSTTSREGRAIFMVDLASGEILGSRRYDHTDGAYSGIGEVGFKYAFAAGPSVEDIQGDGYADFVYFADLGGNLWRWDLRKPGYDLGTDEAQSNWPLQHIFESGGGRSLYSQPEIAVLSGTGERWMVLGTGNRADIMDSGSVDSSGWDRIYVLKDIDSIADADMPLEESDLADMTSLADPDKSKDDYLGEIDAADGYYIIAAEQAQKFVTRAVVLNDKVTIGYFAPGSDGGCVQSGSAGQLEFDLATSYGLVDPEVAEDAEDRDRFVGVGMPRDPRPSYGSGGGQGLEDACLPGDTDCSCDDKGPCCQIPDGGWSPCHAVCGRCSLVIGGSSSGGTSGECSSCASPWMPKVRSWREE